MKTIIAATDFTPNARNAVDYAAALAEATGSGLMLFNHYAIPISASDMPGMVPVYVDDYSAISEAALKSLQKELLEKWAIPVDIASRGWSAVGDVEELFEETGASLVVAASRHSGPVVGALFGEFLAPLMRRGKVPLLVVPEGAAFSKIKKTLLACDDNFVESVHLVAPLVELCEELGASVEVVNVRPPGGTGAASPSQFFGRDILERALSKVEHFYLFEAGGAVPEAILRRAVADKADLVAMLPHHHSWLSDLFSPGNTQRVASLSDVPLLVLGEQVPHRSAARAAAAPTA